MKKIFFICAWLLSGGVSVFAQNLAQDLQFIYIGHDENTPTYRLVQRLQETYDDARNYPDIRAVIFYLPNGEQPMCVRVNTTHDVLNVYEFGDIIEALQTKRSHDVESTIDCLEIQKIFEDTDFIDDDGEPLFRSVEWIYYVNSTFWSLSNNENVIANLFFIMDMERYIKSGYMRINVWYGREDSLSIDRDAPFGDKALYRATFMPIPY